MNRNRDFDREDAPAPHRFDIGLTHSDSHTHRKRASPLRSFRDSDRLEGRRNVIDLSSSSRKRSQGPTGFDDSPPHYNLSNKRQKSSDFGFIIPENRPSGGIDFVSVIPSELVSMIFNKLETADIHRAMAVSRDWHSATTESMIWRDRCMTRFEYFFRDNRELPGFIRSKWNPLDWKLNYETLHTCERIVNSLRNRIMGRRLIIGGGSSAGPTLDAPPREPLSTLFPGLKVSEQMSTFSEVPVRYVPSIDNFGIDGLKHGGRSTISINEYFQRHIPMEISLLDAEAVETIEELVFSDNQISEIPPDIGHLASLRRIEGDNNNICHIDPRVFEATRQVEEISLSNNQLDSFQVNEGSLTSLRVLDLSVNYMSDIDESITFLGNLVHLNLQQNQIMELPENIGELASLMHVDLKGNWLQSLPRTWAKLINIVSLDLSWNKFRNFPGEIFAQGNALRDLSLEENSIEVIPSSISNCRQLSLFNVKGNNISALPTSIGSVTTLMKLDVSSNRITSLPESIQNLQSLSVLDVSSNPLMELSDMSSLRSLAEIDVHGTKINEISIASESIAVINCGKCEISTISPLIFKSAYLGQLDLSGNRLADVPVELFTHGHLKILNISNNNIRRLPDLDPSRAVFSGLKELDISGNELVEIQEAYFVCFRYIKRFNASNNKIRRLPATLGAMHSISKLSLSRNLLSQLPQEIGQLMELSHLDVSCNSLTQIPEDLGNCITVYMMDFSKNMLQELPSALFARLSCIEHLNCSENSLRTLPDTLWTTTSLTALILSGNELTFLSHGVSSLRRLKLLDISSNRIQEIPSEIGRLRKLQEFSASSNTISEVPESFRFLKVLAKLNIGRNLLRELPRDVLILPMKDLDVSDNFISELPKPPGPNTSLRNLQLDGNKLNALAVSSYPSLEQLSVARNVLRDIPDGFEGLEKLVSADLSHNSIHFLRDLSRTKSLQRLYISGNPCALSAAEGGTFDITCVPRGCTVFTDDYSDGFDDAMADSNIDSILSDNLSRFSFSPAVAEDDCYL